MGYDGNYSWPISDESERKFWDRHEFREVPDSLGCALCGWAPKDPIHMSKDEIFTELIRITEEMGLYGQEADSED